MKKSRPPGKPAADGRASAAAFSEVSFPQNPHGPEESGGFEARAGLDDVLAGEGGAVFGVGAGVADEMMKPIRMLSTFGLISTQSACQRSANWGTL